MCGAAKVTVAEVEELYPAGELDPNEKIFKMIAIKIFIKEKIMKKELSNEQYVRPNVR